MRIAFIPVVALLFDICLAPGKVAAQDTSNCLYNDEHFHIQDFKAEGPRVPEILKMMDNHVCRTTLMSLAVTLAHDPLIDRDFAPVCYTQTDGQVMYYNAIHDVLVAHKFLALPEQDCARVDPLMNAFNLKDARAPATTSRRWSSYIRVSGAALARSTSRNRSSPKRLPAGHRVSIACLSMRSLT